jgi:hypothetical protein
MAQSTTHACTSCGNTIPADTRFCPNCGMAANSGPASYAQTQQVTPPPPPTPTYSQQPQQPQTRAAYQSATPNQQTYQPVPTYARPQKNSGRGVLKVGVILLLLLLILGAGGYFAFRYITGKVGGIANTGTNSQATPTQAPLITTPINATVNYASVNITIINAQQATSFADDKDTPAAGVVRLNLHAVQSDVDNVYAISAPSFIYADCFTLLLPGGNKIAVGGYKVGAGPNRKSDQTNWIDFPAATSLKVDQMTLQMGKDTEEQILVPLTGHADLSTYQAKQSTPNTRVQFGDMFWTLKKVTFKLSDSGTQVDKDMRFVVLTFSIDNPGTEANNGYPPDYIRLEYGGTTITLEQDIVGDTSPGTSNIQGIVSFLVPKDTTAATFILLPGHLTPGATSQATIPFQLPQK